VARGFGDLGARRCRPPRGNGRYNRRVVCACREALRARHSCKTVRHPPAARRGHRWRCPNAVRCMGGPPTPLGVRALCRLTGETKDARRQLNTSGNRERSTE
jgi:hypothetical protein